MSIIYPKTQNVPEVINVKDYGAKGDGVTDDTAAIQAAIDAMVAAGGGRVVFPGAVTYLISGDISVYSCNNWEIDLCGSTLKMEDEAPVDGAHSVLDVAACQYWCVRNGTLDGNVNGGAGRTPAQVPCHNMLIYDSKYGVVENIRTINSVVDGFYVASSSPLSTTKYSDTICFLNCTADGNSRQGISVIQGYNIVIQGGAYINTSGLSPQAGIDFESNSDNPAPTQIGNKVIGAKIYGNAGAGIKVVANTATTLEAFAFIGNEIRDNGSNAIFCNGSATIIGNYIKGVDGSGAAEPRGAIDIAVGPLAGNSRCVLIQSNIFEDIIDPGETSAGCPCVYVHGGTGMADLVNEISIIGNSAKNVTRLCTCYAQNTIISHNRVTNATYSAGAIASIQSGAKYCTVSDNIYTSLSPAKSFNMLYIADEGCQCLGNKAIDMEVELDYDYGTIRVAADKALVGSNQLILNNVLHNITYTTGSHTAAPENGETVTGDTSGTTATYWNSSLTGGAWDEGDAAGVLYLRNPSAAFNGGGETLTFSGGATAAIAGAGTTANPYGIVLTSSSVDECVVNGNMVLGYGAGKAIVIPAGQTSPTQMSGNKTESQQVVTATANDATPSVCLVDNGGILKTANTVATTITMLDDGYAGKSVRVIIGDGNTTVDFSGTNLKGNSGGDWSPASGDHMDCVFDGTDWYCNISDNTA